MCIRDRSNSGIGAVNSFEFTNEGVEYSSPPTIIPFRHAILKDITGTFAAGDILTSHSGTVTAFDSARQLISINTTANLAVGNVITVGSSKSGTIANISIAAGTAQVGQIAKTAGNFLTSAGKISEIDMKIRGSGEILGTKQSGGMELKIADLMRDAQYLNSAEKLANILISRPNEVEILMKRWVGHKQNLIAAQ